MIKLLKKIFQRKNKEERIKIPKSVQQALPIKAIYEDGIFQVGKEKYSKSFKFTDINYAVAGQEEQENMFINYGTILNMLDESADSKLTIINRKLNKVDFNKKMKLDIGDDYLTPYRKEYNDILASCSIETNGIIQEKIITITIDKPDILSARTYFSKTSAKLESCFSKLGSKLEDLDINERIRIFYDFYRVGEEDIFHFDIKEFMKKGHSFKDYICPDTFEFKSDYFKMGDRYGRVLYLKEYATYLKDDIASELTDLNKNMMLSIDIKPMSIEKAIREAEKRRLGVEKNISDWQRRQNENNNFSAVIPYSLEQQREASKEMLNDLTNRNQKMFLCNLIIVHTADSKEELDSDTENLKLAAGKYLCQLTTLKFQQMDGLNTVLPSGTKRIKTNRTLITESLSAFMPFKVQEIQDPRNILWSKCYIKEYDIS